jgi:hypothetical protein
MVDKTNVDDNLQNSCRDQKVNRMDIIGVKTNPTKSERRLLLNVLVEYPEKGPNVVGTKSPKSKSLGKIVRKKEKSKIVFFLHPNGRRYHLWMSNPPPQPKQVQETKPGWSPASLLSPWISIQTGGRVQAGRGTELVKILQRGEIPILLSR